MEKKVNENDPGNANAENNPGNANTENANAKNDSKNPKAENDVNNSAPSRAPRVPDEQIVDQYPGGEIPNPIPVTMAPFTVPTNNLSESYGEGYRDGYSECYERSYTSAYAEAFARFVAPKRNYKTRLPSGSDLTSNNDDSKNDDSKNDDSKNDDSKNDDSKVDDSKADESKADDSKVDDSKTDDSNNNAKQTGGFTHDLEGAIANPEDKRDPHEEEGPEPPLEEF